MLLAADSEVGLFGLVVGLGVGLEECLEKSSEAGLEVVPDVAVGVDLSCSSAAIREERRTPRLGSAFFTLALLVSLGLPLVALLGLEAFAERVETIAT